MIVVQSQVFLVLLLSTTVGTHAVVITEPCGGNPADVIFLMDTSNSIWGPDFEKQLDFVKEVVARFQITKDKQRVGVITFSSNINTEFQLNTFNSKHNVRTAIDRIAQAGGVVTRTGDALHFMRRNGFLPKNGGREGVTKIGIVITDGRSTNTTRTAQEASKTRSEGIHLFAVGVGNRIDVRELYAIASKPQQEYAFRVRSFAALDSIKELLAIQTCTVTDPPTTLPPSTTPMPTTTLGTAEPSTTIETTTVEPTRRTLKFLTPPIELKEKPQPNEGHVLSSDGRKITLDEPPDHIFVGPDQETIFKTQGGPSSSNGTGISIGSSESGLNIDLDFPGEIPPSGKFTKFNNLPFGSIPGPCDTGQGTDLVFVVDEKNGETLEKFWKFIRHLIRDLDKLGTNDVRVRFVQPCAEVQELRLDELKEKSDIIDAFDRLQVHSGRTPQLLRQMTDLLSEDESTNKIDERRKIGVYLTDGRSDDMAGALKEAQSARLLHDIELFGIGIGHAIDPTEMRAMVSCPVEDHLHLIRNAHGLTDVTSQLFRQLCLPGS